MKVMGVRRIDLSDRPSEKLPERTRLSDVKVDSWGGWIFINMDTNSGPLRAFLGPAAGILDPFELEKIRYEWRQWVVFDGNWKTALEAFMEAYHVTGTHTRMLQNGDYYSYSAVCGSHGVSGFDERGPALRMKQASTVTRTGKSGVDPRISTYELQKEIYTDFSQWRNRRSGKSLVLGTGSPPDASDPRVPAAPHLPIR